MELATDEIRVVTPKDGLQVLKIAPLGSLDKLAEYATEYFLTTKDEPQFVLYLAGHPRSDQTRRIVTNRIIVQTDGTVPLEVLKNIAGISTVEVLSSGDNIYAATALRPGAALTLWETVAGVKGVTSAAPELSRLQQKRAIPNDALFSSQWHLLNTRQNSGAVAGIDIDVVDVWDTRKGTGVRIALVDDGLQYDHPDLAANYSAALSHDFNRNSSDPYPDVNKEYPDEHGTSCAGVAGGRGFNGIGICGVAPEATLVGLRLIGEEAVDSQEADCFAYKKDQIEIKSNSWGPPDGYGAAGPGVLAEAALKNAAETGRGGKGTVFIWAAGNGRAEGDYSNIDGYANSIYTTAVGAVDDRGKQTSYSESGPNLLVSAPSDNTRRPGIISTDLKGEDGYNPATDPVKDFSDRDYTRYFGGTSSACPVVAGLCALMLEANPNLGWRDVQEILMRTAARVSSSDKSWIKNTAGFVHSIKFGAGMVDAKRAVAQAVTWHNLTTQVTQSFTATGLPVAVPDNKATGVTFEIPVNSTIDRLEHVVLEFSASHDYRGDLAVTLTSPTGIVSELTPATGDTGPDFDKFKFMTVADWGEKPNGTWKIKVADRLRYDSGQVTAAKLHLYGTSGLSTNYNQDPSDTQPPVLTIAKPLNNSTTRAAKVTVSGKATDNVKVDSVVYSINAGPWQKVKGTATWSFSAPVVAGTNTIEVRAIDTAKNIGTTQSVVVVK